MKKPALLALAAVGMALALSACGGGSGGGTSVTVTTPPTGSTDPNAKFGTQFAADFKAPADSTPASVSAGDVVPVDPAASPSSL